MTKEQISQFSNDLRGLISETLTPAAHNPSIVLADWFTVREPLRK